MIQLENAYVAVLAVVGCLGSIDLTIWAISEYRNRYLTSELIEELTDSIAIPGLLKKTER